MKIKDVLNYLNDLCPFKIQDKYDNSGLIIGNINDEVKKVLVSLDCTDEVVNEAKYFNSNLIISHHPVNISNIKTLKDNLFFEKTIIKAIKNNISIIAVHTNIDFVYNGVNNLICNNLNIINKRILKPHDNVLIKIVIFTSKYCKYIIKNFIDKNIDSNFIDYKEYKYDDFNKMKNYNQNFCFLKKKNIVYDSLNIKLEIILSKYFSYKIFNLIDNLIKDYDILYEIYPLLNNQYHIGMGMIGDLKFNLDVISFLKLIKYKMNIKCLRHTKFLKTNISSVALCGGRGISLIDKAIDLQADVFITSDIKYHEFFNANNQIMLVDIGHYESEQYIVQFLTQSINKKFNNNLAINSQINTNPIKYF